MKIFVVAAACLTVATVAVVGLTGSSADPEAATPDGAVRASVEALRRNDLNRFVELALDEEHRVELEEAWADVRRRELGAEERAEFAELVRRWTEPGAEEARFDELLPELRELEPQLQLMAGMMVGMVQSSIERNEELSYDERDEAQALLGSLGKLLMSDALASEANLHASVGILCATARELELASLDELTSLDLEEALLKGGVALAGVKRVLFVYGLDLDAFLDSVTVEVLSEEEDRARVRIDYDFFGTSHGYEAEMMRRDGRWTYARSSAAG